MTIDAPPETFETLGKEFDRGRLTLYLGAGVSAASGLPTWQRLVVAMYLSMLSEADVRAYANYLHAVAEWTVKNSPDPLEITAQKIRRHFGDDGPAFLRSLRRELYAVYLEDVHPDGQDMVDVPERGMLRDGNPTLNAVAGLIERGAHDPSRGVEDVITYNYDNLLEMALPQDLALHVVDRADRKPGAGLAIYHVHGYVPMTDEASSTPEGIIFTEEQYHEATNVAYSWSNLVQIRGMSSSTGLMVGLSLSDRNIRRLLHALRRSPTPARCYAVLQRPTWRQPHDHEEQEVHQLAQELYRSAARSGSRIPARYGVKEQGNWQDQVRRILDKAQDVATEKQEGVLQDLGVTPIWYDRHDEVPEVLSRISPA